MTTTLLSYCKCNKKFMFRYWCLEICKLKKIFFLRFVRNIRHKNSLILTTVTVFGGEKLVPKQFQRINFIEDITGVVQLAVEG